MTMALRIRPLCKLLIRLSITVALLLWVFARVDTEQFRQTVRAAKWQYLIGVWLSAALFFLVQSAVMKWILKKQDCEVGLNTIFGASSITTLYSLALPGILSAGVKWYILKRSTGKGANVLSGMLYNQVLLTGVMMAVGLAGLIVTNPTDSVFPHAQRPWLLPATCSILMVLLLLSFVLVLNERTGGAAIRLLEALLGPLPRAVREKGRQVLAQIAVFQTVGLRFHLTVALIDAVQSMLVNLLMYFFAARAAGIVIPIGVLIWLGALVFTLGRIPISVANLGVREVTLVGLLAGYGVARPAALLMSMILFSAVVFMACVGVSYQLFWAAQFKKQTN